ncbi:metal-dependent transcriptional regulator [Deinococcus radiophilus]|uniref:Manganese transport regulator n=1 Tax=Deinococcus radiophilus TaxID=32062 RepID=A0A3S0IJ55_9DEIO|nr:metal-dependent transcriptional regulator [Deinococcus radiophilus]RTR25216.1 metal-dependent transcriptional regulator [Deinococcus radiophilus]UFA50258.1 metal-dependent transcriptional regulator [Deinococcus radiophilus]
MSRTALLSPAAEDYLKHMYLLSRQGRVSTQALADALEVAPASVTGMLRKLTEQGLVLHAPYRGATLTIEGERAALEVLRHHRLLELFLYRALGVPLEEVHEEAEALEHALSERLEARMAAWLGEPEYDPHGDPIPSLGGQLPQRPERPLSSLRAGDQERISRVPDLDRALLRRLLESGLRPEAEVLVIAADAEGLELEIAPPPGSQSTVWTPLTLTPTVARDILVHGSTDGDTVPAE